MLSEGINDPGIFKAVVVVGGPGSGKSMVVKALGTAAFGLKHIVSDHFFELLLKKAGKPLDLSKAGDYSPQRKKAQSLTNRKEEMLIDGRLGVVYESSLSSLAKSAAKIKAFRQAGYEVKLIHIVVDKETALDRNRTRKRKIPGDIVAKLHDDIGGNMKKLAKAFAGEDVLVVRNGADQSEFRSDLDAAFKKLRSWLTAPPKTAKAKAWIAAKRSAK